MPYQLTVTSTKLNPNYDRELDIWKSGIGKDYYGNNKYPDRQPPAINIEGKSLVVDLTDEEFQKLKKETISIFE